MASCIVEAKVLSVRAGRASSMAAVTFLPRFPGSDIVPDVLSKARTNFGDGHFLLFAFCSFYKDLNEITDRYGNIMSTSKP